MLHTYTPEMGQHEPVTRTEKQVGNLTLITMNKIEMSASIGHYGNWYVKTAKELKGRGIKCVGEHIDIHGNKTSVFRYKLTDRAFEILREKYDIKMESVLD